MNHVTQRIEAWLGGELSPAEAESFAAHLAVCPECTAAVDQARSLWDLLGTASEPVPAGTPSVWEGVRGETLCPEGRPGLFGVGGLWGGSLAAAAVAAGLILAVALPWSGPFADVTGGSALAEVVDPETHWLTETSWGADDDGYGMAAVLFSEDDVPEGTTP